MGREARYHDEGSLHHHNVSLSKHIDYRNSCITCHTNARAGGVPAEQRVVILAGLGDSPLLLERCSLLSCLYGTWSRSELHLYCSAAQRHGSISVTALHISHHSHDPSSKSTTVYVQFGYSKKNCKAEKCVWRVGGRTHRLCCPMEEVRPVDSSWPCLNTLLRADPRPSSSMLRVSTPTIVDFPAHRTTRTGFRWGIDSPSFEASCE